MDPNETGFSTLVTLRVAHRFNAWMFEEVRPYLSGKILEIGSGLGNISSMFIREGIPLSLSDYDPDYFQWLKKEFGADPHVKDIYSIDLADKNFETVYASILHTFDAVFALNVIEHIKDDKLAVENCYKLLVPGGRLVLLVPAWPSLYNRLDKELHHFRRYTSTTLRELLSVHFDVMEMKYFNLAGILGWWLTGTVLRRGVIGAGQAKLYNKLVP